MLWWASGLLSTGQILEAGVYRPTSSFISLCSNTKERTKVHRVPGQKGRPSREALNEKDCFPFSPLLHPPLSILHSFPPSSRQGCGSCSSELMRKNDLLLQTMPKKCGKTRLNALSEGAVTIKWNHSKGSHILTGLNTATHYTYCFLVQNPVPFPWATNKSSVHIHQTALCKLQTKAVCFLFCHL